MKICEDYNQYYSQVINIVEKSGTGVLATSHMDKPTTRTISCVVYDGKIAFQTSTKLKKFSQISKNRNVSLCFTNINIQGEAIIQDKQTLENRKFRKLFELKHKSSFDSYSHMSSSRVIEIIPQKIVIWLYEEGEPYRIFLNTATKEVKKEAYDHSNEN